MPGLSFGFWLCNGSFAFSGNEFLDSVANSVDLGPVSEAIGADFIDWFRDFGAVKYRVDGLATGIVSTSFMHRVMLENLVSKEAAKPCGKSSGSRGNSREASGDQILSNTRHCFVKGKSI
jgi:hypothetical protein